jgi:adenine-specific DNA-methyltransferase
MILLPKTRYYGSKRKLVTQIWNALEDNHIRFDSMLDLFGGTGIVSYFMAQHGKHVIYNDILSFNCEIAKALLCTNKGAFLEDDAINLLKRDPNRHYKNIITEYFYDIYFTNEENSQIDTVIQNIPYLELDKQASAYYILFQSCMIKRPFNIFHRRNLNLRTNFTKAKFGNKVTWDQPFYDLFIKFTKELNLYQFDNSKRIEISNTSALKCEKHADLIYIDTPYFSKNNSGNITYHNRYHFLEGLMHYEEIPSIINLNKVNKEMSIGKNLEFENRANFLTELDQLINYHKDSVIAISYTTEGYPSIEKIQDVVQKYKRAVVVCHLGKHSFALNRNNASREEVLILGMD